MEAKNKKSRILQSLNDGNLFHETYGAILKNKFVILEILLFKGKITSFELSPTDYSHLMEYPWN